MLYRNSFAFACYLVVKGEVLAAKKILRCLYDLLGWDNNKTYFSNLIDSIEEFAEEYSIEIVANMEILDLFEAK